MLFGSGCTDGLRLFETFGNDSNVLTNGLLVLQALDIGGINTGLYAGILLCIALVFRAMLYAVLVYKKR